MRALIGLLQRLQHFARGAITKAGESNDSGQLPKRRRSGHKVVPPSLPTPAVVPTAPIHAPRILLQVGVPPSQNEHGREVRGDGADDRRQRQVPVTVTMANVAQGRVRVVACRWLTRQGAGGRAPKCEPRSGRGRRPQAKHALPPRTFHAEASLAVSTCTC
jgi:hypothetical protein